VIWYIQKAEFSSLILDLRWLAVWADIRTFVRLDYWKRTLKLEIKHFSKINGTPRSVSGNKT